MARGLTRLAADGGLREDEPPRLKPRVSWTSGISKH